MATAEDARSDGSLDSVSQREALAWQELCNSSQHDWEKAFPHVKGQDDIWRDFRIYTRVPPKFLADKRIALEVTLRACQIQQLVYTWRSADCEAELSSFLWLLFSSIQMCDVSSEENLQPAAFSLERGDNLELQRTLPITSPPRNSQQSGSPDSTSPGNNNNSNRSGSNMSVPGAGISEQEQLQLGGKLLKPDMTILCCEGGVQYMYAVVEVKDGTVLTLAHIRQSFCQGIVATVANGLKGFKHTTRSLLINSVKMVILEYTLKEDFINKMIASKRALTDISSSEVMGSAKIVFAGQYDLFLKNVPARRALVGLLAPSLRHDKHLTAMRTRLQAMRIWQTKERMAASLYSLPDSKLWERIDAVQSLINSEPGTVSDACLYGSATVVAETASLKRKQDDGLASHSSPNKKPKTATSSELDVAIKAAKEADQRREQSYRRLEEARQHHDKECLAKASEIAASDETPLQDVPIKPSDIQLWATVKSILATADLTTFSMCDLMRQLHEKNGVDMSCKRDIIESFAHYVLKTYHMG